MAASNSTTRVDRLTAGADAGALRLPATAQSAAPSTTVPPVQVKLRDAKDAPPVHACQQTLTLSFFFDGTGNNLDADISTFEHSNVARLYRSHLEDSPATGQYRFYLPGIGTLFNDREVNDPGGTMWGRGFGDQGQARLDWAFARLKEKVKDAEARAENPTNKICWIKVAAFGFSRGAAQARAFCRDLQKLCVASATSSTGWRLRQGQHPIEITFLGLFDTVASAGLPPSANNTLRRNRYVQAAGWLNPVGKAAQLAFQTPELKLLAFGEPGADPAPGPADGHATWANGMQIGSMVTRCVHMVAAHENRNSFGSDSTLYEASPNHFSFRAGTTEMLYPGVHSDVGGGYRPGEGGCRSEKGAQLSLIPLRTMHAEAIRCVPLRPLAALEDEAQRQDFAIDEEGAKHFAHMTELFVAYRARADGASVPGATHGLGGQINAHMRLYYAWRFHRMRAEASSAKTGGGEGRTDRIKTNERQFGADRQAIDAELKASNAELYKAQQAEEQLRIQVDNQRMARARYGLPIDASVVQRHEAARRNTEEKQVEADRIRARRSTAADDSELNTAINKYDRILLEDARHIMAWMKEDTSLKLRPHYAALMEAYRDEYERGRGLSATADAKLIELFDHYVHDSMAGFDTDESWPSDPRIIYVGGDRKLRYASRPAAEMPAVSLA
jgi:uncharacterized protein (DUF2235 family)